ncbi:hypothetical protein SF12_21510, partial [Streptomyces sp. MBRL 601]
MRDMAADRELLRIPVSQEEQVEHLTVAPDGRHLAATFAPAGGVRAADGTVVQVWDLAKGRKLRELPADYGHGAFSPDGRTLLTTTGYALDLTSGSVREDLLGGGRNTDLVFSPDGEQVAVLKESGLVELWDGALRERRTTMPSGWYAAGTGTAATPAPCPSPATAPASPYCSTPTPTSWTATPSSSGTPPPASRSAAPGPR